MRVVLIRHPEPVGAQGLCYGRTDLDVAPESVARCADRLREVVPDVASALVRAGEFRQNTHTHGPGRHATSGAGAHRSDRSDTSGVHIPKANLMRASPDGECDDPVSDTVIVSSPLGRCVALAAALGSYYVDDRLTELDFGDWENKHWDEINRADFDEWAADYVRSRVPGGESWADLRDRVGSFLADLRCCPISTAVVVTHAGVIRAVLSLVMGVLLESTWDYAIPYGCIVELDLSPETGMVSRIIQP